MSVLHLGFIEQPYSDASFNPTRAKALRRGAAKRGDPTSPPQTNTMTTGDVAEILEAKYHIVETFFETHENEIVGMLEQSVEDALQNIVLGAPAGASFSAQAETDIGALFKTWLSARGMDDTATPGVPTEAARRGVSHRFLHPYAKRPSRPSFIDTGLYEANFIAYSD